jgi:hypothetical protein
VAILEGNLDFAAEHAARADALDPGAGSYSLALIAGARGDRAAVLAQLERSAAYGQLPSRSEMVREAPQFQEFLAGIFD